MAVLWTQDVEDLCRIVGCNSPCRILYGITTVVYFGFFSHNFFFIDSCAIFILEHKISLLIDIVGINGSGGEHLRNEIVFVAVGGLWNLDIVW